MKDLPILRLIEIRLIKPSRNPVRQILGDLQELTESVSSAGLIEPLVVRPVIGEFEVIAGNRRLEACRRLRWKEIPCLVVDLPDREAMEIAIAENFQRRSLSCLEEAKAFRKYVEAYGWGGISQLANQLGTSVAYISHRMKLLDLPGPIIALIQDDSLDIGQAEELMYIKDRDEMVRLARAASELGLSSRTVRKIVNNGWTALLAEDPEGALGVRARKYKKAATCLRICKMELAELIDNEQRSSAFYVDVNHTVVLLSDSIGLYLKRANGLKVRTEGNFEAPTCNL